MFNVVLCIEYLGTAYHGWQKQPNVNSIQAEIERALTIVAAEKVEITCAGRTDAGVHATNQYANFFTKANRSQHAWSVGVNTYLPPDIRIKSAVILTDMSFNARYSAQSRSYRYVIFNSIIKSALFYNNVTAISYPLDANNMHVSAQYLLGTHDFTSFRGPDCQSTSPIRTMFAINVERNGDWIYIDLTANAFLHNMVRNIVGSLLEVGRGKRAISWLQDVLYARARSSAGITAPAQGLYLTNVMYPEIGEIR